MLQSTEAGPTGQTGLPAANLVAEGVKHGFVFVTTQNANMAIVVKEITERRLYVIPETVQVCHYADV